MPGGTDVFAGLSRFGINVSRSWVDEAVAYLRGKGVSDAQMLEDVIQQFLDADLHAIGKEGLPRDIATYHKRKLSTRLVLQVDEVFNAGEGLEKRQVCSLLMSRTASFLCLTFLLALFSPLLIALILWFSSSLSLSLSFSRSRFCEVTFSRGVCS